MKIKRINSKRFGIALFIFVAVITMGGIGTYNIVTHKPKPAVPTPTYQPTIAATISPTPEAVFSPNEKIKLDTKYQQLVWDLCLKNNVSYEMVLGLLHKESEFDFNAKYYNKDGSIDQGIAQINSKYSSFFKECAIRYCEMEPGIVFNPYVPEHGIKAGIGGICYFRDYWRARDVQEDDLMPFALNSYQMGAGTFESYVLRNNTINRSYDRDVFARKEALERFGEIVFKN
jgi:hypothetical protein